MEHEYIKYLKENNETIRLIKADNAPLIISFLYKTFKNKNQNVLTSTEINAKLSDHLYLLNQPESLYPLQSAEYLANWANDGYLRAWYENNNDEPFYELTPASEKAIEWMIDLEKKDFIGTESRLVSIFSMLKEIAYINFYKPERRIEELERQKAQIDIEIAKIQSGQVERLEDIKIKEKFLDAEETARKLLADFKQIEQNFRDLDTEVRRKQINSTMSRGKVLDDIFRVHDFIWETDQGRSFKAFWEFLMSKNKQDEFNELVDVILNFPEVQEVKKENVLERLKVNLIDAGDKVHRTNHQIIEQLRRFLNSKVYLENKRIMDLIYSIESTAIHMKDNPPVEKDFITIDDKARFELVMDRPIFNPPKMPDIMDYAIEDGEADISTQALYEQLFINTEELRENIRRVLRNRSQATLKEVTDFFPVERGLAELITYFSIATKDSNAIINEDLYEKLVIYNNETHKYSEIKIPQTIFCK